MDEIEENKNSKAFIIAFWVIVLCGIGFFGWRFFGNTQPVTTTNPTQNNVATSTVPSTQKKSDQTPTVTGQMISGIPVVVTDTKPQKVNVPMPSLERPLSDTSKLDPAMVSRIQADMSIRINNLKKNNTSFQDWIDLGFDRKTLGDYEGARDAWEYVSLLYPQNQISFGNLGDLYVSFLKDFPKAEIAYKTAIQNESANVDNYRNLFNLYILENKNTEAVALLKSGIAKNPTIFNLHITLARYYRDAGDNVSAKTYYDQAISIAQKQKNTLVVDALKIEVSELK